ncbi:ABC transporter ATP-binding protein [Schleiferilactobacillus harbinensis]|uniref:ABC transporter ATP-binding protein n=1 Tax=Schleiferilactobacillus harbinensis TaxID=304207 RepID=UPI00345ED58A
MRQYFLKHTGLTLLVTVLLIICSALRVFHGVVNAYVLDGLVAKSMSRFLFWTGIDIGLFLVLSIFLFGTMYLEGVLVQKMSLDLRLTITRNITHGDYAYFHRHDTGTYGSWLTNDITMIEDQGFQGYFYIVQFVCDTGFTVAALIQFHWSLVIVSILLGLITYSAPQLLAKPMKQTNMAVTHGNEHFLNQVQSFLQGFDTLFALNLQQRLVDQIAGSARKIAGLRVKQNTVKAGMGSIAGLASIVSQVGISAWTGLLVLWRLTSVGAIMATGNLSFNLLNSMANLGPLAAQMKAVQPLFAKYAAQADNQSAEKRTIPADQAQSIALAQLSYQYPHTSKPALQPLSLTVASGTKVAITGPSGVGKSTLLNILNGKLPDYQGTVTVAGVPLKQIAGRSLRDNVLYIDQSPYVFNGTVRDNLALGQTFSDEQIMTALRQADLGDFVQQLPQGLATPVGEDGRLFSGGQRQRLALARGILRQRHIMLIDEGTSSLDTASALKVEDSFLKQQGLTVIFVTHQLHAQNKDLFDQVVTLA